MILRKTILSIFSVVLFAGMFYFFPACGGNEFEAGSLEVPAIKFQEELLGPNPEFGDMIVTTTVTPDRMIDTKEEFDLLIEIAQYQDNSGYLGISHSCSYEIYRSERVSGEENSSFTTYALDLSQTFYTETFDNFESCIRNTLQKVCIDENIIDHNYKKHFCAGTTSVGPCVETADVVEKTKVNAISLTLGSPYNWDSTDENSRIVSTINCSAAEFLK